MLDDTFLVLVATPIPGAAPGGRNARYDEPYTSLESEVGKLDNPAAGEPDWKRVEELARDVLCNHSKELLACAWAAFAGLRQGRLPQLAVGLAACLDLLNAQWDICFPPITRVKARRNALEWLGERAAGAIQPQDAASPQGQEALAKCLAALDEIDRIALQRFEGEDSGLTALRRALRELSARPAPGAAAAMAGASGNPAPAPGGVSAAAPMPVGPVVGRAEAIAQLQEITEFFQRTEPHSPMGFLLARAVAWNSKTFQEVMLELLRNKDDAQRQVFDDLGLKIPPKAK